MKSIISGTAIVAVVVACLSLNVQAKSVNKMPAIAVSDTSKMAKDKMKMEKMKMSKMKKDSLKMSKDKMKMDKKKMSKDTAGKM